MTAPIASGWSDSCRVGLAPTEKRRLSTDGFAPPELPAVFPVVGFVVEAVGIQLPGDFRVMFGHDFPHRCDGSGDFDSDNLTDAIEVFDLGTDPCLADTDDDGRNDDVDACPLEGGSVDASGCPIQP